MTRINDHLRTGMMSGRALAIAVVATVGLASPIYAGDRDFRLPDQCKVAGDMPAGRMMDMEGMDMETMPEHSRENIRRMMVTMPAMHDSKMNEDPDVAFACGMIAHHQGAIDMAQVLLEHGDDAQMIELAGQIIAAQADEIEEMTAWLVENAR